MTIMHTSSILKIFFLPFIYLFVLSLRILFFLQDLLAAGTVTVHAVTSNPEPPYISGIFILSVKEE